MGVWVIREPMSHSSVYYAKISYILTIRLMGDSGSMDPILLIFSNTAYHQFD